jgi:hypothetical protein
MPARDVIWEIGRPDSKRQWDFFVVIDQGNVPLTLVSVDGYKHLMAAGKPLTHFSRVVGRNDLRAALLTPRAPSR